MVVVHADVCSALSAPRGLLASIAPCDCGDCLFPGDNLDKQLVRYQRKRKGQVIQPFQGDVTDNIHSQEAAGMSPPSNSG